MGPAGGPACNAGHLAASGGGTSGTPEGVERGRDEGPTAKRLCDVLGAIICMDVVGAVNSGCGCVKGLSAWNAVGCCLWRVASTCSKHGVVKWVGWSSDPVRMRWTVVSVWTLEALAVWM